jgi:hypothetical protein
LIAWVRGERGKQMKSKIDLNKFKEVVGQLKTKQKQLQGLMNKETLNEAKKYAESSKQEIQRLIKTTDVKKVKSIILKEAAELKKLQASLPGEIAKLTRFVDVQRKELEKVLKSVNALEAADFIQKKVTAKVPFGKKQKASGASSKRASKKPAPKVVEREAVEREAAAVNPSETQPQA